MFHINKRPSPTGTSLPNLHGTTSKTKPSRHDAVRDNEKPVSPRPSRSQVITYEPHSWRDIPQALRPTSTVTVVPFTFSLPSCSLQIASPNELVTTRKPCNVPKYFEQSRLYLHHSTDTNTNQDSQARLVTERSGRLRLIGESATSGCIPTLRASIKGQKKHYKKSSAAAANLAEANLSRYNKTNKVYLQQQEEATRTLKELREQTLDCIRYQSDTIHHGAKNRCDTPQTAAAQTNRWGHLTMFPLRRKYRLG